MLLGLYVSFFKDEYKIVPLKFKLFLRSKVQSILVPPIFGKGPLTSFALATALLAACGFLVLTVFIETTEKKFSYAISDMIVYLPSTAFAFSCLKKNCFFRISFCTRKCGLCFAI